MLTENNLLVVSILYIYNYYLIYINVYGIQANYKDDIGSIPQITFF